MENSKTKIWLPLIIAAAGMLVLIFMSTAVPGWEALPAAVMGTGVFCLLLIGIDKYVLVGYDLLEEIKKNNMSVAVVVLAFAVVIAGTVIGIGVGYR